MIEAMKATLAGTEAPKPIEQPVEAKPEKQAEQAESKANIEVSRDKKGRFIDSAPSAPDTKVSDDVAKQQQQPESAGIKQLREQYEKTKQEYKAAQEELAKLRGQLNPEEYKVAKEELERLRAERAELMDTIKAVDFTRSPEFKSEIEAPLKAAESRMLQYVPENLKGTIRYLAEQPASAQRLTALEQAVSELSPIAQAAIVGAVENYSVLVDKRNAALENAKHFAGEIDKRRQAETSRRQQEAQAAIDRHIADALQAASEEIPLFRDRDGDEDWNAKVKSRRENVRKLLTAETDPSRLAEAAVFAEYGKQAIALLPRAEAEIKRLTDELDKLKSSRPGIPTGGGKGADPKPKSFAEAMKAALAGNA
jgi:hypothetical protein